jgi:hypothetical protein
MPGALASTRIPYRMSCHRFFIDVLGVLAFQSTNNTRPSAEMFRHRT